MDIFPGGSARVGLVHLVPMACRLVEVEGRCWATTEDRSFFQFFNRVLGIEALFKMKSQRIQQSSHKI